MLAKSLQELGIGDPFHIILYSGNGIQWATRVWWLIFVLGFKKVSILNGGIKEWKRLGYDLEKDGDKWYYSQKDIKEIKMNCCKTQNISRI